MEKYFELLEITNDASKEDIKQAYYAKLRALQQNDNLGISLEELNEACDYLLNHFGEASTSPTSSEQKGCIEEEIFLEEINKLLKYSLSNSLEEIKNSIYVRTGYNINLNEVNWNVNTGLSLGVIKMMNKNNVNFSMTTWIEHGFKEIIINRRSGDRWFYAGFREINSALYSWDHLQEIYDKIENEKNKKSLLEKQKNQVPKKTKSGMDIGTAAGVAAGILGGIGSLFWNAGGFSSGNTSHGGGVCGLGAGCSGGGGMCGLGAGCGGGGGMCGLGAGCGGN